MGSDLSHLAGLASRCCKDFCRHERPRASPRGDPVSELPSPEAPSAAGFTVRKWGRGWPGAEARRGGKWLVQPKFSRLFQAHSQQRGATAMTSLR